MAQILPLGYILIGLLIYLSIKKISDLGFLNRSIYVRLSGDFSSFKEAAMETDGNKPSPGVAEPYLDIGSKLIYEDAIKNGTFEIAPAILERNNVHTVDTITMKSIKERKNPTVMIFDSGQAKKFQKKLCSDFRGNAAFLFLSCLGKIRCFDVRNN